MNRHYGWVMVTMLFAAGGINFLGRTALSVVAPWIERALHPDPASLGIVFSTVFDGYPVLCFAGDIASNRYGPERVLRLAIPVALPSSCLRVYPRTAESNRVRSVRHRMSGFKSATRYRVTTGE
jgi:hypothetical protein